MLFDMDAEVSTLPSAPDREYVFSDGTWISNQKRDRVLSLISQGVSLGIVMKESGVSNRLAHKLLSDEGTREIIRERIQHLQLGVFDAKDKMLEAQGVAVQTLLNLMEDEDPTVQLRALKMYLDTVGLGAIDRAEELGRMMNNIVGEERTMTDAGDSAAQVLDSIDVEVTPVSEPVKVPIISESSSTAIF